MSQTVYMIGGKVAAVKNYHHLIGEKAVLDYSDNDTKGQLSLKTRKIRVVSGPYKNCYFFVDTEDLISCDTLTNQEYLHTLNKDPMHKKVQHSVNDSPDLPF